MSFAPGRIRLHLSTLCLAFVVASAFYGINMQPEETRYRDDHLTVWTYGWPCTVIRDYAFDVGLEGRTVYPASVIANGGLALAVSAVLGWLLEGRFRRREAARKARLGLSPPAPQAEASAGRDETPDD